MATAAFVLSLLACLGVLAQAGLLAVFFGVLIYRTRTTFVSAPFAQAVSGPAGPPVNVIVNTGDDVDVTVDEGPDDDEDEGKPEWWESGSDTDDE